MPKSTVANDGFNGVYHIDGGAPAANGRQHYIHDVEDSRGTRAHLYALAGGRWVLSSTFSPEAKTANAFCTAVRPASGVSALSHFSILDGSVRCLRGGWLTLRVCASKWAERSGAAGGPAPVAVFRRRGVGRVRRAGGVYGRAQAPGGGGHRAPGSAARRGLRGPNKGRALASRLAPAFFMRRLAMDGRRRQPRLSARPSPRSATTGRGRAGCAFSSGRRSARGCRTSTSTAARPASSG
jgi:hypothetical protein